MPGAVVPYIELGTQRYVRQAASLSVPVDSWQLVVHRTLSAVIAGQTIFHVSSVNAVLVGFNFGK